MHQYAIGDVQGCYESLMRLLERIQFDADKDTLWFAGDLVNRGPDSLKVLRFIKALPKPPHITLGNHDLHLLAQIFLPNAPKNPDDTLDAILNAPDRETLGHWLRQQPFLYHNTHLNCVMTHAGIPPHWCLTAAKRHAKQLAHALGGEDYLYFLSQMYGNTPTHLSDDLSHIETLRVICNGLTRMRFCDEAGHLELRIKAPKALKGFYPWYAHPTRKPIQAHLIFGHWAALQGACPVPKIHAIDTGCVWGGKLTALRLSDKKRFSVDGWHKP